MSLGAALLDEINTPISGVPRELLGRVLHKLVPLLVKVVTPRTGHTVESVLDELLLGHLALWSVNDFNAIVITRIQQRPAARVLWVEWMAGENMDEWVDDWMEVQEAYARDTGCDAIEFNGRRGFWRVYGERFPKFRPIQTVYRQELNG